jgi:D-3-phosphoglycerate dehydrogenase
MMTRQGQWGEVFRYYGYGLKGRTLGAIGVGNIGHEMFRLINPFGMRHLAYDPYIAQEAVVDVNVRLVDLDTLLAESDFVSISCLLNDKTRHLIGEKELRKMKKTAFLINTARGGIIDESALIKALREGWIQGAGLDVFEQEPTPPDNPLLNMDNVIVTAHSLGITDEFVAGIWEQIRRQVSQIISGEVPEGLVNRQVLDKRGFRSKLEKFRNSLAKYTGQE